MPGRYGASQVVGTVTFWADARKGRVSRRVEVGFMVGRCFDEVLRAEIDWGGLGILVWI